MVKTADVKWIKISTSIFDDEKFDAIRTMPDGNDIQLAWFKLLCLAGRCNENGFLMVTRELPYTDEMLASHFRMDVGVVQRALSVFQKLEMVEVIDNIYLVSNWAKHQSSDRLEEIRRKDRERKREAKKQLLESKEEEQDDNSMEIPRKFHGDCSISNSISNNSISTSSKDNKSKSKNTNTSNKSIREKLESLVEESSLSEPVKEKFLEFIKYRQEIKKPYKTDRAFKGLIKEAEKQEQTHGSIAVIDCIDATIRNEWQGIFWNKINTGKKGNKTDFIDNWVKNAEQDYVSGFFGGNPGT